MITEKLWKKISSEWDKSEKYYQKWHKEYKRFLHFNSVAPIFKDRNVLEIGTNAGIQSLEICEHCKSFVGIEKNPIYFKQLNKTMAYAKCGSIVLDNKTLEEFSKDIGKHPNIDSLYLSFVMYHFNETEIGILRDVILPKLNLVIIYNRIEPRKTINNKYEFNRAESAKKLMQDCGFKTEVEYQPQMIWYYLKAEK